MKGLVCDEQCLEVYSVLYWEPMKGCKNWFDVGSAIGFGSQSACSISYELLVRQGCMVETGEESIAVVKVREKGVDQKVKILVDNIALMLQMFWSWKKQDCTSLLMCESKCKLWSNITDWQLEG